MNLRNKILNQNRRADNKNSVTDSTAGKKRGHDNDEEEDDDEEESRTRSVKLNKPKHNAPATTGTTTPSQPESNNKRMGGQGDFLSMYLSEKAGKKKKKKKNKKSGQTEAAPSAS